MANEISFTSKLSVTKSSVTVTNATSTKTQTMATTAAALHHTVQAVGFAAAEAISTGDVVLTDQHLILLWNRDSTNYVTVTCHKDVSNSATCGIMRPGEPWGPVRAELQTAGYPCFKMQSAVAACNVEVIVCDAGDPAA